MLRELVSELEGRGPLRQERALRQTVRSAAAANMNMLRIWGGGTYLPEAFYSQADALGVMVSSTRSFLDRTT